MQPERIQGGQPLGRPEAPRPVPGPIQGTNFADSLGQAQERLSLRVSSHARTRLEQRQLTLDTEQLARLEAGVQRAEEKGVKQPLIMMDDMAFVVSMNNRTIVTAVEAKRDGAGVFTNIDGVVVV